MARTAVSETPDPRAAHAHKLVAETARAAAHELYDTLMSSNEVRAAWRKQNEGLSERELELRFVNKNLQRCLPVARATLAMLLRQATDPALQSTIYEALCLDAQLVRGRGQGNG